MNQTDPTAARREAIAKATYRVLHPSRSWDRESDGVRAQHLEAADAVLAQLSQPTGQAAADGSFVPPAAGGLPLAALESAANGATMLDAWAEDPHGRNFLAHALVQMARDGWLRTEPGEGFEPVSDRKAPAPLPAAGSAVVAPPTDRAALLAAADVAEQVAVRLHNDGEPGRAHGAWDVMDALRRAAAGQPAPVAQQPAAVPQRAYPDCERCGDTGIDPEQDSAPCPECQQAAADTCRPFEVDGETVLVRGNSEMTEQDRKFAAEIIRAAKRKYAAEHPETTEQQAAAADDKETWFGMPGCTCRAFTRQDGPPRYLEPHETVDKVSGWEPGADCPHHAPRP